MVNLDVIDKNEILISNTIYMGDKKTEVNVLVDVVFGTRTDNLGTCQLHYVFLFCYKCIFLDFPFLNMI